MHCSSLGEFEQGRPVLEKIKNKYPGIKIFLTFFSPSGFEIKKDYNYADWVFYLPLDSKKAATRFLDLVKPSLVVFVKYEYWYYYLAECKKRNIPLLMISAIFRKEQVFFKWYGTFYRNMLTFFTHIFVQDIFSKNLLDQFKIENTDVAGDTRFDRVIEIADNFKPIELVENFIGDSKVLVCGSTWQGDEKIIKDAMRGVAHLKLIIAPHEVHKDHIDQLRSRFSGAICYSELSDQKEYMASILIVDNIGLLSRLYHYASITYVGGGFNKGIHNTLEAAVHGKPVLFGPNYSKFKEAQDLISSGGGISINSASKFSVLLQKLLNTPEEIERMGKLAKDLVSHYKGATKKIVNYIEENRLLTS